MWRSCKRTARWKKFFSGPFQKPSWEMLEPITRSKSRWGRLKNESTLTNITDWWQITVLSFRVKWKPFSWQWPSLVNIRYCAVHCSVTPIIFWLPGNLTFMLSGWWIPLTFVDALICFHSVIIHFSLNLLRQSTALSSACVCAGSDVRFPCTGPPPWLVGSIYLSAGAACNSEAWNSFVNVYKCLRLLVIDLKFIFNDAFHLFLTLSSHIHRKTSDSPLKPLSPPSCYHHLFWFII